MTPQIQALSSERVNERCFWAQSIAQGLELYGKSLRDLPSDLRQHCKAADLSQNHISQTVTGRVLRLARRPSPPIQYTVSACPGRRIQRNPWRCDSTRDPLYAGVQQPGAAVFGGG